MYNSDTRDTAAQCFNLTEGKFVRFSLPREEMAGKWYRGLYSPDDCKSIVQTRPDPPRPFLNDSRPETSVPEADETGDVLMILGGVHHREGSKVRKTAISVDVDTIASVTHVLSPWRRYCVC